MRLYINVGDGKPMDPQILDLIQGVGFRGIRRDINDLEHAPAICREFVERHLHPLFVVAGGKMADGSRPKPPEQIAEFAVSVMRVARDAGLLRTDPPAAIEIGNEPDIAIGYNKGPEMFARAVRLAAEAVHQVAPEAIVVSGGIFTTREAGLRYLERALRSGLPEDVHIGYHTYREAHPPERPHPGFSSRDDEFTRLKSLVGNRPIWCTEVGWHTAPQPKYLELFFGIKIKIGSFRYADPDVADFVPREIEINARHGALGYVHYQVNDGPNPDYGLDSFGIRRFNSLETKLVADKIRAISSQYA